MPQPTFTDLHVDVPLTNLSVAYIQNRNNFIATQVFPIIPVDKKSNKYYVYNKDDWFRDEAQVRAPSTESAGSGWSVSTDSYSCEIVAFHKDIDLTERANSDAPLNMDRDAAEFVAQRMLMRLEVDWVSKYFGTGIWSTDVTPSNLWSSYATSDPIADVETGKTYILQRTGIMPNTLVIGYQVWQQLKQHPDFYDRMKYTGRDNLTLAQLAQFFEVDRVFVMSAVQNTAAEGATGSYSFIAGKHALLCYVPSAPSTLQPAAGYTFMWSGVSDGFGQNIGTYRFEMPHLRSSRVESQMAWDNKKVATDLGYFLSSVVA